MNRTARTTHAGAASENWLLAYSIDLACLLLLCLSFALGSRFWRGWFSEIDSVVCSVCIAVGFVIAVCMGFRMKSGRSRSVAPWLFLFLAILVLFYALVAGRPKLTGISAGMAVTAWLVKRLSGESISRSLSLGLALMVPSFVSAFEDRGGFELIENMVLELTSGLAESSSQFHIQRDNIIEFGHGVANRFSSVGRWDSILPFVGISFLCIYLFRRALICSLLTLSMAFLVWMAVRATAWCVFAWYAARSGFWLEWTLGLEVALFATGAALIVLLDQFFSSLLAPIPSEFVNEDLPLVAYLWNWIVLLPALELAQPTRVFEDESYSLEDE
ncbi:hypothetical protein SH449x_000134 [Pirellulaceae bacterium SH449]